MHVMGIRLAALLIAKWTNLDDPAVIINVVLNYFSGCLLLIVTREKQVVLNVAEVASCKLQEE